MRFLIINLAINTTDQRFHALTIEQKFQLIESSIHDFSWQLTNIRTDGQQPFKALLVAPEYFFARCCPETGAAGFRHYDYNDYLLIRKNLKELSERYPYILFVPGTVAWKSPIVRGSLKEPRVDLPRGTAPVPEWEYKEFNSPREFYYRMAEIGEEGKSWEQYEREAPDHDLLRACELLRGKFNRYYGGSAEPPDRKIQALYQNIIDSGLEPDLYINRMLSANNTWSFARNTAFFYLGGKKVGEYTKHSDYQETFFNQALSTERALAINGDGPSVLDIHGIKIGVEICLDHNCDMLKSYLISHQGIRPDVHLILSATVKNKLPINGTPVRIHSSIHPSSNKNGNTRIPGFDPSAGFSLDDNYYGSGTTECGQFSIKPKLNLYSFHYNERQAGAFNTSSSSGFSCPGF